jgi:UDP-glucose 4-epimerase
VVAHLLAAEPAEDLGFGCFIISATSPFQRSDLQGLRTEASCIVEKYAPHSPEVYRSLGWRLPNDTSRVYVNKAARESLRWTPVHDFSSVLQRLVRDEDHRSVLVREIGKKGYHDEVFEHGPYPVCL